MKIVRWIRLMRAAEIALRRIFTPKEMNDIYEESLYRYVSLDD